MSRLLSKLRDKRFECRTLDGFDDVNGVCSLAVFGSDGGMLKAGRAARHRSPGWTQRAANYLWRTVFYPHYRTGRLGRA